MPIDTEKTKYVFQTVQAGSVKADTPVDSCTISTISPDRDGDCVIPEGGDFGNFMKSPVLMWAHGGDKGYSAVPIGAVTELTVMPGQGIKAAWKWLEGDEFADRIKNAWQQGVVRASSIGFRAKAVTPNPQGGFNIDAWELLELSLCAIPVNPEAVRAMKSFGLLDDITAKAVETTPVVETPKVDEPAKPVESTKALDDLVAAVSALQTEVKDIRAALPPSPETEETIALLLDGDDSPLVLIDDADPGDEMIDLDSIDLPALVAEALQEQVVAPMAQEMHLALERARGRVY